MVTDFLVMLVTIFIIKDTNTTQGENQAGVTR